MSQYLSSNGIIASAKRRAMIPQDQSTFTAEDFLAFANEEMKIALIPHIMGHHEDFFLYNIDVPLEANVSGYEIPYRSIGNKLRDVAYVDSNGNIAEMTRIFVEDLPDFQRNQTNSTSQLRTFYISNNEVVLVPSIGSTVSGSLRFIFYMRPNDLVTEDKVGIIQSINTSTGELVLDQIPEEFSISQLYDLIQVKSPHRIRKYDLTVSSINTSTKTITFDPDDLPTNLELGDHVNLACETILPQIPTDLHVVLAHRVAARCLEAMGDVQGLEIANQKLAEMENRTGNLIDNRVEGAPTKIVNRHSILRSGISGKKVRRRF